MDLPTDVEARLGPRVQVMQIITAAMCMGVVALAGVFGFLGTQGQPPVNAGFPLVTLLALGMLAVNAALSLAVPKALVESGLKRLASAPPAADADALLGLRQISLIVGLALLEGAAMLAAISYFLERQGMSLIGAGAACVLMAARFPTMHGTRLWLETQGRRLSEMRQGSAN